MARRRESCIAFALRPPNRSFKFVELLLEGFRIFFIRDGGEHDAAAIRVAEIDLMAMSMLSRARM